MFDDQEVSPAGTAPDVGLRHDFCSTGTEERLATWLSVLDLQIDLFFAREFDALQRLEGWSKARTMLDVGCGNGRALNRLAQLCPVKAYAGIDVSPELIEVARRRSAGIDFIEGDFLQATLSQRFDLILMRFVVQHLDDWQKVLAGTDALLQPQGTLVIVEPDLPSFANSPALPRFTAMLARYGDAAGARGRLRASIDELGSRAAPAGWRVANDQVVSTEQTGPFARTKLLALYKGWMQLCGQSGYVDCDFASIHDELEAWSHRPDATSRIGLRMLAFERA